MLNSSIEPIVRTLSGAITLGQSEPGSDGNEGGLCIRQKSSITQASPPNCLVSYPGHSLGGLIALQRCSRCILQPQPTGPQDTHQGVRYPSTETQSVYSTAPANWTRSCGEIFLCVIVQVYVYNFWYDFISLEKDKISSMLTFSNWYFASMKVKTLHFKRKLTWLGNKMNSLWSENLASTACNIWNQWSAVSILLGLISSVYHDLPPWVSSWCNG